MPAKGQENAVQTSIFLEPLLGPFIGREGERRPQSPKSRDHTGHILGDRALARR
jgi:hypothetical protein